MIGIKDTLDLTAHLHGGNRIADQIHGSAPQQSGVTQLNSEQPANWHRNTYKRPFARKGGRLIRLPDITDTLRTYHAPKSAYLAA